MELTQYMNKLCGDLNEELLEFPETVPESSLIAQSPSIRTAFIEICDKYLGSRSTWTIYLDYGVEDQILQYYRRLDQQKKHSILRPVQPHRDHVPSSSNPVLSTDDHSNHSKRTMYKSLMDAANRVMKEVIKELEISFDFYRNTAVK